MAGLEGTSFGDFEILEKLGEGGMGAVYKARQALLGRLTALKVMSGQLGMDETFVKRFIREAAAAANLDHPNMVQVYKCGEVDGIHYIAMEFVEGESLRKRLDRVGKLNPREAIAVAVYIAQALQYAWNKARLVHRDIKPDNIFLSNTGEVKVGDLGLAKMVGAESVELTSSGMMVGSPHYISPEQARAVKDIDFRTDIYSLGCTLYHMLSGRTPYEGSDAVGIIMRHVNDPPPAIFKTWPQCPVPLALALGKMMAKERTSRHASYEALLDDLLAVHDKLRTGSGPAPLSPPQPAVPTPPREMPSQPATAARPPGGKPALPLPAIAGAAALAVVIAGLLLWAPWQPRPAEVPVANSDIQTPQSEFNPDPFVQEVAALPPEEQVNRVVAKLKELNPGFDGGEKHRIEGSDVVEFEISALNVTDISPVRALRKLRRFVCLASTNGKQRSQLADLRPLRGLMLTELRVPGCDVNDLSPVRGMPLNHLGILNTRITDLSPLQGAPLTVLNCEEAVTQDPANRASLRSIGTLEKINLQSAAQFWQQVDSTAGNPATMTVAPAAAALADGDAGFEPLFNGKDLAGWKARTQDGADAWTVRDGELVNSRKSVDLISERTFRDFELHLEYKLEPGGNSGVYLRGLHEIQLADDARTTTTVSTSGGIWNQIAPVENAAGPADAWQTLDATLVGNKASIKLNGTTVLADAELQGPTKAGLDHDPGLPGPILLQGFLSPVSFRNIRIKPLGETGATAPASRLASPATPLAAAAWVPLDISAACHADVISTESRKAADMMTFNGGTIASASWLRANGRPQPGIPDDGRIPIPDAAPSGFFQITMPPTRNAMLLSGPEGRFPEPVTVELSPAARRSYSELAVLHASCWGNGTLRLLLHYETGDDGTVSLPMADWFAGARSVLPEELRIATTTHDTHPTGGKPVDLFAQRIPVDPQRTLHSLTFSFGSLTPPTGYLQKDANTRFIGGIFAISGLTAAGGANAGGASIEEWTTLPNGWRVGKPVNLGPGVNCAKDDEYPTMSGDGMMLLFHSNRTGSRVDNGIWSCIRPSTTDPWGAPQYLDDVINRRTQMWDPFLSSDGLTLIFVSSRPDGQGKTDLWITTRRNKAGSWEKPENLGPVINGEYREFHPVLSADGLTLLFRSDRPGGQGGLDIWMSTRPKVGEPWGAPLNLGPPVNSEWEDGRACLSADGRALFFSSTRPGGQGKRELWMSTRQSTAEPFGEPVNLGAKVNTSFEDCAPSLSADDRTLYFNSDRPGGQGAHDLWQVALLPPDAATPPLQNSITPSSQPSTASAPGLSAFCAEVAALPAEQQAARVAAELKRLNPEFDPGTVKHEIGGHQQVYAFAFCSSGVTNLAPVRALAQLGRLSCSGRKEEKRSPLQDLSPLRGMRLKLLDCYHTEVADLSPLRGMPLDSLSCFNTRAGDLAPLEGMPLKSLNCMSSGVGDLAPLSTTRQLQALVLHGNSAVQDLTPLRGLPLESLTITATGVSDLSPLAGIPLKRIMCEPRVIAHPVNAKVLRAIKTLQTINNLPAAEFWKQLDPAP